MQIVYFVSFPVCTSLNFTNKPQRTFCSPPEHTSPLLGCHTSQGAFILPSYPFSSPRHSPKHTSPPTDSLKKSQDHAVNFSNSWPLKSFEGLPKPTHQKKFSSPISGEEAGNILSKYSVLFPIMCTKSGNKMPRKGGKSRYKRDISSQLPLKL